MLASSTQFPRFFFIIHTNTSVFDFLSFFRSPLHNYFIGLWLYSIWLPFNFIIDIFYVSIFLSEWLYIWTFVGFFFNFIDFKYMLEIDFRANSFAIWTQFLVPIYHLHCSFVFPTYSKCCTSGAVSILRWLNGLDINFSRSLFILERVLGISSLVQSERLPSLANFV